MVLRMTNFNIFGVHWKIWLLKEGSRKTNKERGLPKKGGRLGQFADLKGRAWQERGGGCFWAGVDTPIHTMNIESENEKMGFWYVPGFPNINSWTVLVVSISNLQLKSNVWQKRKVDCHTRTKVVQLQILRFCNVNCIKKTEPVKANSL